MARCDRVAEEIKKEISIIIHDKLKDPRLGFVTITRVELTQDLRFAKVFFSVLGKEQEYVKTKAALNSALGLIRSLVAQRLNLRFAPEIAFRDDHSSEYSVRIEEILNEIKQEKETKETKQAKGVKEINGAGDAKEAKKTKQAKQKKESKERDECKKVRRGNKKK